MYTLTDFGDYTRRVYPGVYTPAVGFSRTCVYIVGTKKPASMRASGHFLHFIERSRNPRYFPIQKRLKISPSNSSEVNTPVI